MILPMPVKTNSCPCCVEDMPAWVGIVILVILISVILIMIPIWADVIGGTIKLWKEFINDIKWKIKKRRNK